MKPGIAVYRASDERYLSDTCDPLRQGVERGEVHLRARVHGAYPGTPLPEGMLPGICSVGYWDAVHDQSWGLDWHRNEGLELTFVERGKTGFSVDTYNQILSDGDLTVTRPWQQHRVGNPDVTACRLHWLILDVGVRRPNQSWRWPAWLNLSATDLAYLTTVLSQNEQPVWRADDEVAHYFSKLADIVDDFDQQRAESRVRLYVSGLLLALCDVLRRIQPTLDPSLSSTHRTVELFLASLPDHIDRPWDLCTMASACGLGRSRFSQYCRQITNMSPNDFLTRCRIICAAALLLRERHYSITDIALRTGFGSSQYFSTVFKRHIGCSPREYRCVSTTRDLAPAWLRSTMLDETAVGLPDPQSLGTGGQHGAAL